MGQPAAEMVQRLGNDGLTRVLDDLLDKTKLTRLATSCELKYPGVRVRTIKRDRLILDIVASAEKEEKTRETIARTLDRETRAELRRWSQLSGEDKAKRVGDDEFLRSRGNLGRHLWFLATTDDDGDEGFSIVARQRLLAIVTNGAGSQPKASPEEQRLKRRLERLEKKVQHLEGQLTRAREGEKRLKRDLIERKGDLAEARMLAERQRSELEEARRAIERSRAQKPVGLDPKTIVAPLERAIKRLGSGQKKLSHTLEKLKEPSPKSGEASNKKALETITNRMEALHKELLEMRRERKQTSQELDKRLQTIGAPVVAAVKKERKPRVKEVDKRVGVFVDVQNMYYGARKLKGKLDFDALMSSAVGNRRLIQSTAYVVESKEIDQSSFIARLQQKAIEVRRKTLKVRADGSMKGDWDMELALDILDAAAKLDVVVLVSGDGDFTSLVKRVKRIGPRVEVIAFPRNTAKSLLESADRFVPLDRKFMIYKRNAEATGSGAGRTSKESKPERKTRQPTHSPASSPPPASSTKRSSS